MKQTDPGKIAVVTLGCKVNQYESAAVMEDFAARGWTRADRPEDADLCVVNTCCVTGKAGMQSRQAIRRAVRTCPNAVIVVTGCLAQASPGDVTAIEGVDLVLGHSRKLRIPELPDLIKDADSGPRLVCEDILSTEIFHAPSRPVPGDRARPFMKIQDGCSANCTYCIVPSARGKSRSMPPDQVMDHLHGLKEAGFHEAVLTGIHLGSYGRDLRPRSSLLALLERIDRERPIHRVRLSSIEPRELTDDLIAFAAGSAVVCDHFHIPLQSGDDGILRRMGRPYTGEFFAGRVAAVKSAMPLAGIGVDVLVGFPGETRDAFLNTLALIGSLPVTYLHVFPFSPRPGTPAAEFEGRVHEADVSDRTKIMRAKGRELKAGFLSSLTGESLEVVAEKVSPGTPGHVQGTAANYATVRFPGTGDDIRRPVRVRITGLDRKGMPTGERV